MDQRAKSTAGPSFALLEELTAPVHFPATAGSKSLTVLALLYANFGAVQWLFAPEASPLEKVACCLSIVTTLVGCILIFRQRRQELQVSPDGTVEEYRAALASEFRRQWRAYRSVCLSTLFLAWNWVVVATGVEIWNGQLPWRAVFPLLSLFVTAYVLFHYQRVVDQRAFDRILRGA